MGATTRRLDNSTSPRTIGSNRRLDMDTPRWAAATILVHAALDYDRPAVHPGIRSGKPPTADASSAARYPRPASAGTRHRGGLDHRLQPGRLPVGATPAAYRRAELR